MSSDKHIAFDVFTSQLPDNIHHKTDNGLFHDPTVVIVMSKCGANNTHPFSPNWGFRFIGGLSEFRDSFLDQMAYFFDDGLDQCTFIKNGKDFHKVIGKMLKKAPPLTADVLIERGFGAYSWSEYEYNLISNKGSCSLIAFKSYDGNRYAREISSNEDVLELVVESTLIKNYGQSKKGPYKVDTVWFGRPDSFNLLEFNNLHVNPVQAISVN